MELTDWQTNELSVKQQKTQLWKKTEIQKKNHGNQDNEQNIIQKTKKQTQIKDIKNNHDNTKNKHNFKKK